MNPHEDRTLRAGNPPEGPSEEKSPRARPLRTPGQRGSGDAAEVGAAESSASGAWGVRAKLFILSFAVIVGLALPLGLGASHYVRGWLQTRAEDELARAAALVQESIREASPISDPELGAIAERAADAGRMRVTLIEHSGRTVADTASEGDEFENRGGRPEVAEALSTGEIGRSARHSNTVGTELLYIAMPASLGDAEGVIRVARPLSHVDAAVRRARLFVVVIGALMVALAALMTAFAAQLMGRTLRALIDSARAIARGEARRVALKRDDELGGAAGSLNALAGELEGTVEALAQERARFALVLESMSEAVIAVDDHRRVVLYNPAVPELLDLEEPIEGRPLIELVRSPDLHELLTRAMAGTPGQAELELPGERKTVLARATPQRDASGCVIVMHDVSELRRLETVRRDFVANVSHELRTPVSVIRANAETLMEGAMEEPDVGPSLLDALHRNAERLASLVADLLDLSRLEAGRYRVELESVGLRAAAERARDTVTAAARSRAAAAAAIRVDVESEVAATADPKALDQILMNLVDNAVKYSGENGHVVVRGRREGEEAVLEVIDDGPGVAPAERARLFERFYRVDPGRSREMGGTGLGLSIVKHLVETLGGRVGVDGAMPRGSIFWVRLPAAPCN